jgi:hypothetical protein
MKMKKLLSEANCAIKGLSLGAMSLGAEGLDNAALCLPISDKPAKDCRT